MTKMTDIKNELMRDIDALRTPDGYLNAGIPNYNHLFGRDACVSALQLLNIDQTIARSTLKTMARYQAKHRNRMHEAFPGKMPHEHFPGGTKQLLASFRTHSDTLRKLYILLLWRFPYYGTVDAGAWFIILLHRYFKKTGDETFLREMWPAALGVMSWLEIRATNRPSELVAYRRTYFFGLLNQSWKDTITTKLKPPTAMVEVQGYYYEAYTCMSELSRHVFNNNDDSQKFARKAEKLKNSLNTFLWQEEADYFSLAINDRGEHDNTVTSNPGHLLFTSIISDAQAKSIVDRLMADDMLTPYGVRTLSSAVKSFDAASYQQGSVWPFDNWVLYQGLLKRGYVSEANIIKKGLCTAYEQLGNMPELYSVSKDNTLLMYPEACTIQAWSAGALINMIAQQESIL